MDENGYHGLLNNISAFIITTKGGIYNGTEMEAYDFQTPYLKAILSHMGIQTKNVFSLEGMGNPKVIEANESEVISLINQAL